VGRREASSSGRPGHSGFHPQTYLWQGALLLLLASSGRRGSRAAAKPPAEAAALLERLRAAGMLGYGDNGPFPLTPDQATPVALTEAVALLGDGDAAGVLYQKLRPFAGRVVVTNTGLLFLGTVDHWLGRLAATMGRPATPASPSRPRSGCSSAPGSRSPRRPT